MFEDIFSRAMGTARVPYPCQRAFAEAGKLPDWLTLPTGVGQTAAAMLGLLHRRPTRTESTT
jgi:hypothetical protein